MAEITTMRVLKFLVIAATIAVTLAPALSGIALAGSALHGGAP
jgi:hypothetical protein